MKLRVFAYVVVLALAALPMRSAAANAAKQDARGGGAVLIFREAVAFSYTGDHAGAQSKFAEYLSIFPRDLLAELRLGYDLFVEDREGDGGKLNHAEYVKQLAAINRAITDYERYGCAYTQLKEVADGTLDCYYVGASLYSLRMVLRGENEGWTASGLLRDREKFVSAAKASKSPQSLFPLGAYEFLASEQGFFRRDVVFPILKIPHDRAHAVKLIRASLKDNASPFVDDIYFFILDAEDGGASHGKKSELGRDYPRPEILRYLRLKYPQNKSLKQ